MNENRIDEIENEYYQDDVFADENEYYEIHRPVDMNDSVEREEYYNWQAKEYENIPNRRYTKQETDEYILKHKYCMIDDGCEFCFYVDESGECSIPSSGNMFEDIYLRVLRENKIKRLQEILK